MPKFKVVNPDAPEEIDFYQDIPLVDPDTGADQLDSDGNILVRRYVNHTVSIKGITEIKNALPAIKTNTRNLEELYQYSHAQNEAQQIAINENSSAIVDLNTSTSEIALELDTLKNKINGIQGIDIDDLKDYVYTQVPLIKNSYLPLTGGTITGNLTIEEGTITGSLTGVASNATADVNNKKLTSYIADIMGANAQLSIIKGDGTTSVLSINNVLNATNATNATQDSVGQQINTTYVKGVTASNATITVTKGNGTTSTATINNVENATNATNATNADKLDGLHASASVGTNTVVARDSNGYVNFNYINSNTNNNENPTISQIIVTNGSDNYYRKASLEHLKKSLNITSNGASNKISLLGSRHSDGIWTLTNVSTSKPLFIFFSRGSSDPYAFIDVVSGALSINARVRNDNSASVLKPTSTTVSLKFWCQPPVTDYLEAWQ